MAILKITLGLTYKAVRTGFVTEIFGHIFLPIKVNWFYYRQDRNGSLFSICGVRILC